MRFIQTLRDGSWLTPGRLRVYPPLLLFFFVIVALALFATSHEGRDARGTPIGADFLDVYAAGILVRAGRAPDAYDWQKHRQTEETVMNGPTPYYAWHYPPPFFAVARMAALLPYPAALTAYLTLSALFFWFVCRVLGKGWPGLWLFFLSFPGLFINALNGQNGFLTAALFGAGGHFLEKKPLWAGLCFGLLAYKPQFFVLIPLALLAGRFYRAFFASLIGAAGIYFLSWLWLGDETWISFFASTETTRVLILENGAAGWARIQSLFAALRLYDCPLSLAYALQAALALTALVLTLRVWRRATSPERRMETLGLAALLLTPYLMDYDLVLLALPVLWLVREGRARGFGAYEKSAAALLWVWPLFARSLGFLGLPLTPLCLAGVLALVSTAVPRACSGDRDEGAAPTDAAGP